MTDQGNPARHVLDCLETPDMGTDEDSGQDSEIP